MTVFSSVQTVTAKQREIAQGQPRQSRIRFHVVTNGIGNILMDKPLSFATLMLEEPTFSFGATAVVTGGIPLATACVMNYVFNKEKGLYSGVYMGFRVDDIIPTCSIRFSLTFEGVAMRQFGNNLRSNA